MTDHKATIIAELDVLRRVSVTETAGVFKARTYAAAIKTLGALPHVRRIEDLPAAQKGDGLGKEVRAKIAKIIEEGSLNISPEVRARADALDVFAGIYGVGPKKAEELLAAGYTTLAELRTATAAGTLKFTKNQLAGLKYYEDINSRIPRAEMDAHAALLMGTKPATLEGVIVGSYRRGRPESGDIDMLVRTARADVDAGEALAEYVDALRAAGYIREVLAQGEHKCLAIATLPGSSVVVSSIACNAEKPRARRLDLLVAPPAEFPFAVFYFTGCDTFNVRVRALAQERGFTLNEHALTHVRMGKAVTGIKTERDIFAALKIRWVEPVDRTGPDAVIPL